tara:strand:- start:45 stop:431 length:387 start_codon:yes stop_codon:yes gene_type:complete
MTNTTTYFQVTATIEGFDEILFGSYEMQEAREELYITKPDLKRAGYINIRIEKKIESISTLIEPQQPVALKSLKQGQEFKRKRDSITIFSRGDYNRADAWNAKPTYTCEDSFTGREIFLKGSTLVFSI